MKIIERKPRLQARIRWEDQFEVKDDVYRRTGLRVDLDRLGGEQCVELLTLTRKLTGENSTGLDDKERARWERLVELGAVAAGHFDKERRAAAMTAELARKVMTPKPPRKLLSAGTVQLPAFMFEELQARRMDLIHFMVLAVVLNALMNRAPLHARMEVRGDAVVVDNVEMLLAPFDPDGDVQRVGVRVRELEEANLLNVSRHGIVEIRLSPYLLELLGEETP